MESEEFSEENHMAPETIYKKDENRMSPDENMALGRRIVDALNTGNLTAIDEVFDAGYVDRTPNPGTTPDREGFKQGLTKFRAAFPDFRYTIEDEIVSRFSSVRPVCEMPSRYSPDIETGKNRPSASSYPMILS